MLSQQVLNVYYYRVTSITGLTDAAYAAFDAWFTANLITPIKAIQVSALVHTAIQIRNLTNGLDYYENAYSVAGTRATTTTSVLPPNVTHTFRLVRESLATRNGYKRYAGVDEQDITSGTSILSSTLSNAIIAALKMDYISGAVTLAEPVIPKRPIVVPTGSYVYSSIGDAQYRGIGTQNTRKIGRGS